MGVWEPDCIELWLLNLDHIHPSRVLTAMLAGSWTDETVPNHAKEAAVWGFRCAMENLDGG